MGICAWYSSQLPWEKGTGNEHQERSSIPEETVYDEEMTPEPGNRDLPEVERVHWGDQPQPQPRDCPGQVEVEEGGGEESEQPAQRQGEAGEEHRHPPPQPAASHASTMN